MADPLGLLDEKDPLGLLDSKPKVNAPATTPPEEMLPEWARKHPNLYGIAGAARETLGPIGEALAMAGGAAIGATATSPSGPGAIAGGVAGAGLGYAGARQALSDIDVALGNKPAVSIPQAARDAVSDVGTGAAMEAGGQIAGKAMSSLVSSAPRLYESAMKPSTTLKAAERAKRVSTALQEGIPVSKAGLQKSKDIIAGLNKEISTRVKDYSSATISRDLALQPVEQLKAQSVIKNINPKDDLKTITRYMEDIQGKMVSGKSGLRMIPGTQPEQIPLPQAQQFKQTLNKELNQYYANLKAGKVTPQPALAQTKAAMAQGLREEITKALPELKNLNARESSLIELNKTLERSVNRISNRELIPLLSGIAFSGKSEYSLLKAIFLKFVEHPEVKSKLAIALAKANEQAAKSAATGVARSATALRGRDNSQTQSEQDPLNLLQ